MNIKLGTDPEAMFMLQDQRQGRYSGMIPASFILDRIENIDPSRINCTVEGTPAIRSDCGVIFADGASWEFNPVAGNVETLIFNIKGLLKITTEIQRMCSTEHIQLSMAISPSVPLNTEMLDVWGDPSLAEFGCDPDASIHPREVNPSCINASVHPHRYCGGHIHFGYLPGEFEQDEHLLYNFISIADATIGMLGIIMDEVVETSATQRRLVYGQPGVYRFQPHGIEYRTTSNSWMLTPTRSFYMLSLAEFIPTLLDANMHVFAIEHIEAIRKTLITGDRMMAVEILTMMYSELQDTNFETLVLNALQASLEAVNRWETEWA